MKKITFILTLIAVMLLTACSTSYEKQIVKKAKDNTTKLGYNNRANNPYITDGWIFTVKKEENQFFLDLNGYQTSINIPDDEQSHEEMIYTTKNAKDLSSSSKYQKIINSSKEKIFNYINSSSILKEKEKIKEYINTIGIKEAEYTDNQYIGAYFSFDNNCLFVNNLASDSICEWMIVHEFVHAISNYTHNFEKNPKYLYTTFNEVLTDVITSSMQPKLPTNNMTSLYMLYYQQMYPYIYLLGEKSIESYFYGYDIVENDLGKDKFELFIKTFENFNTDPEFAYQVYNDLILSWYADYIA